MRRLLLALLAFWAALGAVVAVVVVAAEDEPPPRPPGPMTCDSLQRRAERCADGLAELAADLVARHMEGNGEPPLSVGAGRTLAATVAYSAISEGKVAARCRRHWSSSDEQIRRLKKGLRACFARSGCEAFVGCVRRLADGLDLSTL